MSVPQKVKLRVIELRAEGLSYANIAKETKIAKQTAVDIIRDNIEEVETLQAIEMEALIDASKVNQRGRIEQLSELHTRLREEIGRRDLSEVPTDKLIKLYLNTSETLKKEVEDPDTTAVRSQQEQQQTARNREYTQSEWGF